MTLRRLAVALTSLLAASIMTVAPAFACIGQIKVALDAVASGQLQVRGYGFWADPRPVRLAWEGGDTITTVQPDASGTFAVSVDVPAAEGTYRLIATQGENDPEPAYSAVVVKPGAATAQSVTSAPAVAEDQDQRANAVTPVQGLGSQPQLASGVGLGGVALAAAAVLCLVLRRRHTPVRGGQSVRSERVYNPTH